MKKVASHNTATEEITLSAGPTTEQVAEAIGWHPESVRRAIREGRIKAIPFGRTWRIPQQEFFRILANGLPVMGRIRTLPS